MNYNKTNQVKPRGTLNTKNMAENKSKSDLTSISGQKQCQTNINQKHASPETVNLQTRNMAQLFIFST